MIVRLPEFHYIYHSMICFNFIGDTIVIASCFVFLRKVGDFPGGALVRNPPANAGDTGSCPGLGRSHMPRSN